MYITNKPEIARIAENSGVDWIFIDLEILGKEKRQAHLDTVISRHAIEDIEQVKNALTKSRLLVRINPIHDNSKNEIDEVIKKGADIVMLPYFKTKNEVQQFIGFVNRRVKTCLLLETPEAVDDLDEILNEDDIDYVHIGLNDLHLGYKMKFMFQLLADGTVESIIKKLKRKNITYGFGGIAQLGQGLLPSEFIITEHYRLGSSMTIMSRSFFSYSPKYSFDEINTIFVEGVAKIRNFEKRLFHYTREQYNNNTNIVKRIVQQILEDIHDESNKV